KKASCESALLSAAVEQLPSAYRGSMEGDAAATWPPCVTTTETPAAGLRETTLE
ncbi:hypothetical protein LTR53_019260, partial [Teratosphaeriaceae sp. CCFEE 6253]